jgi:hypothetical protein
MKRYLTHPIAIAGVVFAVLGLTVNQALLGVSAACFLLAAAPEDSGRPA